MEVVVGRILEDDRPTRDVHAALDQLEEGALGRAVRPPVDKRLFDVVEPAQRVEVVALVVVEGTLLAQPLPDRVGVGVDLEVVNFSAEYKDRVFAEFLREYQAGRTPNPDVLCNAEIKFKAFLDHAMNLGAERIATGHYAQVREFQGRMQLLKGEDGTKDQSYFLHRLNQAQLKNTMFPVGHIYKRDLRKIAEDAKLPNFAKKDSTGICFIGERPFREFLQRYLPTQPGEIRNLDTDKVMGQHQGLMYHTIGQRDGLGIGGVKGAPELPWYVAQKDMAKNVLYVVQGHDHPALLKPSLKAQDLSWVVGEAPHTQWVYNAKTRYRQPDAPCEVERVGAKECEVVFAQPQWAITPGQSVVIYESTVCLGGGIITG